MKRIGSFILIFCLLSMSSAVLARNPADTEKMNSLLNNYYKSGIIENDYSIDSELTRGEFISILNNIIYQTDVSDAIKNYIDISSDDQYYDAVSKAIAYGYVNGTGSNTVSPYKALTREEAVTMVGRILGITETNDISSLAGYNDADDISDWAISFYVGLNEF